MNLALVLGQNSENVKPKLSSFKDNLNIECFVSLQHFINSSIKRELMFDRVIIISTLLKTDDYISDLYNYWDRYSRHSEIIFLCKKSADEDLAKDFLSKFCSTTVAAMLITSTTLHTLSDAVVLPVSEITRLYGIADYLSVEVEEDFYEEPKPDVKSEPEPQKVNNVSKEQSSSNNTLDNAKEKRTLFGVLFGKKKKNVVQEKVADSNISEESSNTDSSYEDNQNSEEQQNYDNSQQMLDEEVDNDCDDYNYQYEDSQYHESDNVAEFEDYSENYDENCDSTSSDNSSDYTDDFNDSLYDSDNVDSEIIEDRKSWGTSSDDFEEVLPDTSYEDSFADEETDDFDFSEPNGNFSMQEEVVEEDFGDLVYTNDIDNLEPVQESNVDISEEVDDLDIDLSVGSAEEEYRKKTEQPKVIKETVVKEIIKSVKTSSVLDNIYKGTVHKLVIVAGDRCSGVTTTAWSLALHFAQKVPVLYFDCDTVNHGLMNYINYFEFKNYEESHLKGVKLCRNSRAFDSCVCKWDTNMNLLTTDFGVDVDDEELVLAQGIVA